MFTRKAAAWSAALLLAATALGACEAPLFPEDAPRSPYERYMALRGRDRPASEGGPQARPALRQRLRPLGEP